MNYGLENKVALITGSSQGIGHAIAATLAAEGCRVIITGRDEKRLAAAKEAGAKRAVILPVLGGVELYRTLRKEAPALKVIMISGYPLGDENRELLSEGVVDWIQKPLPLETLTQALRKALSHS